MTAAAPGPTADEVARHHATARAAHAKVAEPVVDAGGLAVTGSLPPGLVGTFLTIGPDTDDLTRWGMGPGLVQAVHLGADGSVGFRRRPVAVTSTERPDTLAARVGLRAGRGNSNLVLHAGRVLALHEVGLPHLLTDDLDTVGLFDFDGRLTTAMCAHPKVDAATGELVFYGCGVQPPFLTYHVADAAGTLVTSRPVDVAGPTSMHDVAVSGRWCAFIDQPNVVSFPDLLLGEVVYTWDPDHPPRLGLVDRRRPDAPVRWIDMPARDVTHVLNAFDEDDGRLVVDVVARTPAEGGAADAGVDRDLFPTLRRWTVDPEAGTFAERPIAAVGVENPKVDDRVSTRRHRHGYAIEVGGVPGGPGNFMSTVGWVRVDTETGEVDHHHVGAGWQLTQPVFAPRPGSGADDDGWLVGVASDHEQGTGALLVLDAADLAAGPVASVALPGPLPATLDALWRPAP